MYLNVLAPLVLQGKDGDAMPLAARIADNDDLDKSLFGA